MIYVFIILAICVLDQLTKVWAMDLIAAANGIAPDALAEGNTLPIFDGILHFTYLENTGMSFGLLQEHRWIFLTLSVLGILALAVYLIYIKAYQKSKEVLLPVAFSMMIGGGIGNMFDRIVLGYVVDFVDFCAFDFWVWIFNFADACVCIGAALMVLSLLFSLKKEKKHV